MSLSAARKSKLRVRLAKLLIFSGLGLTLGAVVVLLLTFYPVVTAETNYYLAKPSKEVAPIDSEFGLIIPKIFANAKVIPNVDPYNEKEYQWQLTKGVAHARGTVFPGQIGNVFIFAHSAGNFYEANRFNAVFYLLPKLVKGDEIYLFYKKDRFKYQVTETKLVDASEVKYLTGSGNDKTITLMTCWPPGTTLKRFIVLAKIVS